MGERQDNTGEHYAYQSALDEMYALRREIHRLNPEIGPILPHNQWIDTYGYGYYPTMDALHQNMESSRRIIQRTRDHQRRIAALTPSPYMSAHTSMGSGVKKKRKGRGIATTVRNAAYSGSKFLASVAAQQLVRHPALKAVIGAATGPIIDTLTGNVPNAQQPKRKRKRAKAA